MLKLKNCLLITFLSISFFFILGDIGAQVSNIKKVYTGPLSFGKATYSYIERDDERVFDGAFSFEGMTQPNMFLFGLKYSSAKYILKGDFGDGKRVGKWTASITLFDKNNISNKYSINSSGFYINGEKNGKWIFKVSSINNGRPGVAHEYFANYEMGKLINGFNIGGLKGFFNYNRDFSGSWSMKKDRNEYLLEFEKGVLYKLIIKDTTTGKINLRYNIPIDEFNSALIDDRIYEGKMIGNYVEFAKLYSGNSIQIENESNYVSNANNFLKTFQEKLDLAILFIDNIYYPVDISPSEPLPYNLPVALTIRRLSSDEAYSQNKALEEKRIEKQKSLQTSKIGVAITKGLTGRYITKFPEFQKIFNTMEVGKVCIDIKVNELGKIIESKLNPRGTTTSSNALLEFVISNANSLRFNAGEGDSYGSLIFAFYK